MQTLNLNQTSVYHNYCEYSGPSLIRTSLIRTFVNLNNDRYSLLFWRAVNRTEIAPPFKCIVQLISKLKLWSQTVRIQSRCDMRPELLTQRALFCIDSNTKKGVMSQHFVTRVIPPLVRISEVSLYRYGIVFYQLDMLGQTKLIYCFTDPVGQFFTKCC